MVRLTEDSADDVADPDTPETIFARAELAAALRHMLAELSRHEARLLLPYYALDGDDVRSTLSSLGEPYAWSRGQVRRRLDNTLYWMRAELRRLGFSANDLPRLGAIRF